MSGLPGGRFALRVEPASRTSTKAAFNGSADAWIVPGADPAEWLTAVSELAGESPPIGLSSLCLYVIPESVASRRAAALLVVPPDGSGDRRPAPGVLPLRRVARVLTPPDAAFDPPLSSGERSDAFPLHLHLVHPRFGHVGFEASEGLRVADLLGAPPLLSGTWSAAREGVVLPPEIGPIVAVVSDEDLWRFEEEGRETIGVEPTDRLGKRTPKEFASDTVAGVFLRLPKGALARAALWYARRAPATSSTPTWVDRAADWAHGVLSTQRGSDRAREIRRLMQLLREDPEEGLRFAIPLGEDPLERGRAQGSDRLDENDPNFDLRRIGASRGTDAWMLDIEARRELEALYRRRAIEDAAAGRYRRAAYIHAHLLGDLRAAARVLTDGGHFREAAALWRDRLGAHAEAAKCLEEGGLFEDALAIYRDQGDAEAEAQLLERLGRLREARDAWRRAVDAALSRSDPVGAAHILETRLDEVDEAASLLRSHWPERRRAVACLDAWFDLCDRHGRCDELLDWIERERVRALVNGGALPLLTRLGARCAGLQHAPTREALADALRCAVGRAMTAQRRLPVDEIRARLQALRSTDPTDRLFDRDLSRVRDAASRSARAPRKRPATAGRGELVRAGTFQLPEPESNETLWPLHGDVDGVVIARARLRGQSLRIERHGWDGGRLDEYGVPGFQSGHARAVYASGVRAQRPSLLALFLETNVLGRRVALSSMRSAGRGQASGLQLGTPGFLADTTLDVLGVGGGELWAVHLGDTGGLRLRRFDWDGRILEDEYLGPHVPKEPVRLGMIGRRPAVFRRDGIFRPADAGPPHPLRLRTHEFEVMVSPRGSLGRSLLVTEAGIRLFSDASGLIHDVLLTKEPGSRACFTRNGVVAIADASSLRALRTQDHEAHLIARLDVRSGGQDEVLAVVPGQRTDEFAVVGRRGTVTRYRLVE